MSILTPHKPITIKLNCTICNHKTNHIIGWLETHCKRCKSSYDPFEITMPDVVKSRRETMKLTRKEMALKTNYSHKTIKQYELVKCSQKYFNLTAKLIRGHKF